MDKAENQRILGFDNWTGGAHHFDRLVKAFKDRGLELALVHLGSWGNDKGRPSSEMIGNLQVRDISSYIQNGFLDVLDAENPSAVLFMSTDTFAHRAFNRYCRYRNVPTIHLYHGLVSVQAVDHGMPYKVNIIAQFRFVTSKLLKAIKYVWPTYMRALWRTGATTREWIRFVEDIFHGAMGKYTPISADDAKTDRCCVYTASDIDHAVKKYGFSRKDVFDVGNPDLIQFDMPSQLMASHLDLRHSERGDVMYIDTGLIFTGWVFRSVEEFVQHLVYTKRQLHLQGKHLIFKPHPDHLKTDLISTLVALDVNVCSHKEFVARLQNCCASIVETSTAALIPALMGMPLFLASYGKLGDQRFGPALTSYPRAMRLSDIRQFNTLLAAELVDLNVERTTQWIKENSGPLPAEEMPRRVAAVAEALILERRRCPIPGDRIGCQ